MAVLVDWGDSDEIILLWRAEETWTWKDAQYALKQSSHLIEGTTQTVILLLDLRRTTINPNNLLKLMPEVCKRKPKEIARTVVIDDRGIVYSLFQMLRQQYPTAMENCVLVDNVDDAYRMVYAVDALAI